MNEILEKILEKAVRDSTICNDCIFRRVDTHFDNENTYYCFFACECFLNDFNFFKFKENTKE